MIGLIVSSIALGLIGFGLGLLVRAYHRDTRHLRAWLTVIRAVATDERVSRDTVRQCAVDALEGRVPQSPM